MGQSRNDESRVSAVAPDCGSESRLDEEVANALVGELFPYVRDLLERIGARGIGPDGQVRAVLLALGDRIIGRELESRTEIEPATARCSCGATAKRKDRRQRTVLTVSGPVTYTRSEYRCKTCPQTFAPMDDALGMVKGSDCTAALRELMAFVQTEESVDKTAETLEKLLGFGIAPSVVDRAVQLEGARAETVLDQAPPVEATPTPETLLVEVDGCHAPHRDGWHEVKIGVVADAACRVEKPPSAAAIARAHAEGRPPRGREVLTDKAYVASRQSLEQFKDRLWREVERQGGSRAKRIALVGDGAPWIWNLGEELFRFPKAETWERAAPEFVGIVDWYHAVEHVWTIAELIHTSRTTRRARTWEKRWEAKLWDDGNAAGIACAARRAAQRTRGETRKALLREAGYFETNAERMKYPTYRAEGLPVGSGPVEGACKTVVQSRCKRAGMRWSTQGLARILALRTHRLNRRWSELWPELAPPNIAPTRHPLPPLIQAA